MPEDLPRGAVTIRPARANEAASLSELALRSKASWGYPAAFIAACREELTYTPDQIDSPRCIFAVAEVDGAPAGFCGLERRSKTRFELEALFVEPSRIGGDVGRALLAHAAALAGREGADEILIQGDPHAEGFYRAAGAVPAGERESASVPGRMLPLFLLRLRRPGAK